MNQQPETPLAIDAFKITSSPIGQEIRLNLEAFEGPMDLLLYLIRREEVDVFDIPISLIADQYLQYVLAMEADNLDIGGEFLVMAATLLSIKARMLLPRQIGEDGLSVEDDPRRDLIERILEYKAFKESALLFRQMEERQLKLFSRNKIPLPVDAEEVQVAQALQEVSLYDLLSTFRFAMDQFKAEEPKYHQVLYNETVEQKMSDLRGWLKEKKKITFSAVVKEQTSKLAIIVLFLALLEMVRIGEIMLRGVVDNDFLIHAKNS